MISNRCARKSLVTNCNSIISKNYLRFLVDSNENIYYHIEEFFNEKYKLTDIPFTTLDRSFIENYNLYL